MSLADVLRADRGTGDGPSAAATSLAEEPVPRSDEETRDAEHRGGRAAWGEAPFDQARLFRARLADAFDAALARLLRELATDVLARELRMAPCDLAALVARLCAHAPAVRVRVAPSDISDEFGLPCVADPALESGDAILEVDGGVIDARLGVRLALLLERS